MTYQCTVCDGRSVRVSLRNWYCSNPACRASWPLIADADD